MRKNPRGRLGAFGVAAHPEKRLGDAAGEAQAGRCFLGLRVHGRRRRGARAQDPDVLMRLAACTELASDAPDPVHASAQGETRSCPRANARRVAGCMLARSASSTDARRWR